MKIFRAIIVLAFILTLTGCPATIQTKPPFPDLPHDLMQAPAPLITLQTKEQDDKIKLDDSTTSSVVLSILGKTVAENYKTCNAYREQILGLQGWLLDQKKLNP